MRRVVITGMGAVSALGHSVDQHLEGLRAGRVAIGPIAGVPTDTLKSKIGGEVRDLDLAAHFAPRELNLMDRHAQLAVLAGREAMAGAGDVLEGLAPERAGVIYGAAVGQTSVDEGYRKVYATPPERPHPFTVPRVMPSAAASQLSMAFRVLGPGFSVASACASASHAIGIAFQMIRAGSIDVALTGGAEAPFAYGVLKSWEVLRVLSTDTCRPFSRDRSGLVLGEGAGVLVLEDLERARARGARIHAEIIGFGMSSDGADITAPDVESASRAMAMALSDAALDPAAVDYVNAHGTATPLNDRTETAALRKVLGDRLEKVPVSSTKSFYGHCLGASGALGVIATTLALGEGFLPPTMNFREHDPECDVDCVPNAARPAALGTALVNAFAFGGLNAVLAVKAAP